MVNPRTDATLVPVDGLEKAIADTELQSQKTAIQIETLNSQFEDFMLELRVSRVSPHMIFLKFDRSEPLVCAGKPIFPRQQNTIG